MLTVTESVVGAEAAGAWRYILRGLWESGLRLSELMSMSWDDPNMIRPDWPRLGDPVSDIPHELQNNDTEEAIPFPNGNPKPFPPLGRDSFYLYEVAPICRTLQVLILTAIMRSKGVFHEQESDP